MRLSKLLNRQKVESEKSGARAFKIYLFWPLFITFLYTLTPESGLMVFLLSCLYWVFNGVISVIFLKMEELDEKRARQIEAEIRRLHRDWPEVKTEAGENTSPASVNVKEKRKKRFLFF